MLHEIPVAVNLSPCQLSAKNLVAEVACALEMLESGPSALEIELTENVVMSSIGHSLSTLRELREMGVRIAVDDFGTGHSSLSYLKSLPIDTLKIDRSFVKDGVGNQDGESLLSSIISMAQSLRLKVVAEGVEDSTQMAFLRANGCDEIQGYFVGRPVPEQELFSAIERICRLEWRA